MLLRIYSEPKYKVVEPFANEEYCIWNYFSKYMRKALFKCLKVKKISETDYLIGPIYKDNTCQVGVTGTVGETEDFVQGMTRELAEEVGILPKYLNSLCSEMKYNEYIKKGKNDGKCRCHRIFSLPLANANSVSKAHHKHKSIVKDDKMKKVGCLLYGSKEQVQSLFSQEKIYYHDSADGIIGVCAIAIKDILSLLNQRKLPMRWSEWTKTVFNKIKKHDP